MAGKRGRHAGVRVPVGPSGSSTPVRSRCDAEGAGRVPGFGPAGATGCSRGRQPPEHESNDHSSPRTGRRLVHRAKMRFVQRTRPSRRHMESAARTHPCAGRSSRAAGVAPDLRVRRRGRPWPNTSPERQRRVERRPTADAVPGRHGRRAPRAPRWRLGLVHAGRRGIPARGGRWAHAGRGPDDPADSPCHVSTSVAGPGPAFTLLTCRFVSCPLGPPGSMRYSPELRMTSPVR